MPALSSETGCLLTDSQFIGAPGCSASWTEWCEDRCDQSVANCVTAGYECCDGVEKCDGRDNDSDGSVDEGVCDDEDTPCEDTRTDPVIVGTGVFTTHPRVDVRF